MARCLRTARQSSKAGIIGYLLGMAFAVMPAWGLDYYVSPDGQDTNPGTAGAPFKTIGKARDVVRTQTASMSADINVYLRGGWHIQSSTLAFTQADNGKNGHDVVYQAYPGEYPVISGGRQITGWTLHDAAKNIWKASAPGLETRQLYVDCVRATRAHKGSGLPGAVQTSYGYTTTDATMQNWGNKSDIELIYNGEDAHFIKWWHWRLGIASISGNAITMKVNSPWGGWCSDVTAALTRNSAVPNDIENAYELLDEAGEWYLNRATDVLYYKPLAGQNMSTVTVIAPVLERLMTGTGALDAPIGSIRFKGITFAHTTWLFPNSNAGYTNQQSNYLYGVGDFVGGSVVIKAANSVDFERCMFKHLGREGLEFSGGAKNCTVDGCVFTDISAGGMRVGTVDDARRTDTRKRDTGNRISNCYIHHIGVEYTDGCGIMGGYVADLEITHNEIGPVPYSGISLGWGWETDDGVNNYAGNNNVGYNYIHHVLQSLNDGGMLYTLGNQAGNRFHHNWFDNVKSTDNGGGVYPDQGSMNMAVDSCIFTNIGKYWLFIWKNTTTGIVTRNNWVTQNTLLNRGTSCPVTGTVVVSGTQSAWPATARNIANAAGIEAAYAGIKSMPCACSQTAGTPTVAAPAVSPDGGTFEDSVLVTLSCFTGGASIRYTTNGTDPTATSTLYSGAFVLRASATVRARAFKADMDDSPVTAAEFTKVITYQAPYNDTVHAVPGIIEAEDYDQGGEGVAYHDKETENKGGEYRTGEGVDIGTVPGGGYNLNWVWEGEWTEYTVDVAAAGSYSVSLRVANAGDGGVMHVEFGGVNKTGAITVPNTGSWDTYQTIAVNGVSLAAGEQVMRISFDTASDATGTGLGVVNLDWISIAGQSSVGSGPERMDSERQDAGRMMIYDLHGRGLSRTDHAPRGIYMINDGGMLRKVYLAD